MILDRYPIFLALIYIIATNFVGTFHGTSLRLRLFCHQDRAITKNMIEIRSSKNSHGEEIDLSGLPKDLRGIQQSIFDLLQHENQQVCIIKAKIFEPSPYDVCLSSLSIIKTHSSIKISVSENCLHIEGDTKKLEIFASWFEFEDNTRSGYHQHFEYFGNEE